MKNKTTILISSAVLLIAFFVIAMNFYNKSESERLGFLAQENSELFIRDYSPQLGSEDAKIFIIEFLDPECESCRKFYPQVKDILKYYEGKVKLIVRYAAFHRNSKLAISALEATRKQGKYWESLELLFNYQPSWGNHHNPKPELIFEFLPEVGIDIVQLKEDMKSEKIQEIIRQDSADLKELKVRGTPTFFVNGKPLKKFGMQYLREAIEEEVKKHY